MEENIKDNIWLIKRMEKEYFNGLMDEFILVNG
jgi:hypothetical protein